MALIPATLSYDPMRRPFHPHPHSHATAFASGDRHPGPGARGLPGHPRRRTSPRGAGTPSKGCPRSELLSDPPGRDGDLEAKGTRGAAPQRPCRKASVTPLYLNAAWRNHLLSPNRSICGEVCRWLDFHQEAVVQNGWRFCPMPARFLRADVDSAPGSAPNG